MRIAYLILAHNNCLHLQRLIDSLQYPGVSFYIHFDKKSKMPDIKGENIFFIKNRVNVYWGGFSDVKATINLMKESMLNRDNEYFVLLSGTDYPIKTNNVIFETLGRGKEYIDMNSNFDQFNNPIERYIHFHFTDYYDIKKPNSLKSIVIRSAQYILRSLKFYKTIPFKIYKGSQWFALSRKCIQYILTTIEIDKLYVKFFKYSLLPDESFFQTIVADSPFYNNVSGNLTYVKWDENRCSTFLNKNNVFCLTEIETSKYLFARKFDDDSKDITDLIDKTLR